MRVTLFIVHGSARIKAFILDQPLSIYLYDHGKWMSVSISVSVSLSLFVYLCTCVCLCLFVCVCVCVTLCVWVCARIRACWSMCACSKVDTHHTPFMQMIHTKRSWHIEWCSKEDKFRYIGFLERDLTVILTRLRFFLFSVQVPSKIGTWYWVECRKEKISISWVHVSRNRLSHSPDCSFD